MDSFKDLARATQECLYCPSLCQHACPVSTAEGRRSSSPWALMSLVHHIGSGTVRLSEESAESLWRCVACGACTDACKHAVPVADTLREARRMAVDRGRAPGVLGVVPSLQLNADPFWDRGSEGQDASSPLGDNLLVAGHSSILADAGPARLLTSICAHLDVAPLTVTATSTLSVGHDEYHLGHQTAFLKVAQRFAEAIRPFRLAVVLCPEALHTLSSYYDQAGVSFDTELHEVAEFILPFLSGVEVFRLSERVGYFQGCHLRRSTFDKRAPQELLERVLEAPPVLLDGVGCCGGTGCFPSAQTTISRSMAEEVIARARTAGLTRIVTFSIACLSVLRAAAPADVTVDHGLRLVADALKVEDST